MFYLNQNLGLFVLRLGVFLIFFYHGMGKLKMSAMMAQGLGWSKWKVIALGLVETVSSVLVLTGFHFRYGAVLLGLVMIGAIWYKIFKWKTGFSKMDGMGWEFDLILLAANVAIFFVGAGGWRLIS